MKKTVILFFSIFLFLTSCSYTEVRKLSKKPVDFQTQKTYILRENVFQFFGKRFNVWNMDYYSFGEWENRKKSNLFKIREKLIISRKEFIIQDNLNQGKKYFLQQQINDQTRTLALTQYHIIDDQHVIATLSQTYADDYFTYDMTIDQKKMVLSLENPTLDKSQIINHILFTLKDKNHTYCQFYKKLGYFKNEYEVIMNQDQKEIDEVIFISLAVFIDQILREKKYDYKY